MALIEEFFRQVPEDTLPGDLSPGLGGTGESAHLHRYLVARSLCRGKQVLDLGSGEGHGAALLAQTASDVIGMDRDAAAVAHAARSYRRPNLVFQQAAGSQLPLPGGSRDVVVSFGMQAQSTDEDGELAEIRRILRPGGILVLGLLDITGGQERPLRQAALHGRFAHVALLRQRVVYGSVLLPDEAAQPAGPPLIFEQSNGNFTALQAHDALPGATVLVALCSDEPLPGFGPSLFVQGGESGVSPTVQARLDALADREAPDRDRNAALQQLQSITLRSQATTQENARLADLLSRTRQELRQQMLDHVSIVTRWEGLYRDLVARQDGDAGSESGP